MDVDINKDNPMDTGEEKNWYTAKELAADLNVNYMTVIRALKSGQIHGIRVGANWRIYHTTYIELIRKATGYYGRKTVSPEE